MLVESLTDEIPATLRDGYEVHRAALAHGLDVVLYPRQVLMASPPGGGPELAFVHGVPQSSTLSAVTYAQDKRMRRELLQRASLPVPEGATFAIGRDRGRAREFARQIGYPVVVKPAVGDNLSEVFPGIQDERQLDAAIDYLRTPEAERPTFTRTAYGLTLLLEPDEDDDGRAVAPSSYQFLIERHVPGRQLRLLVLDGQVSSAVLGSGRPGGPPERRYLDVTEDVHPSVRTLASEAARVIPGLTIVAVDLVLGDHRRPLAEQDHWIVGYAERPWLATQVAVSDVLGHRLGNAILASHAATLAVALGDPRDEVAIDFTVEGATQPSGVLDAIAAAAGARGLVQRASVSDRTGGTMAGTIQGPARQVAHVFELLLDGTLHGQRAMLVHERHRPRQGGD